jgi:hypothetical protein
MESKNKCPSIWGAVGVPAQRQERTQAPLGAVASRSPPNVAKKYYKKVLRGWGKREGEKKYEGVGGDLFINIHFFHT